MFKIKAPAIRSLVILGCLFFTASGVMAQPLCEQVAFNAGPPISIRFAFWEEDAGLREIRTAGV